MDGADDDVEIGEHLVRIVHGPVGEDIALGARENRDVRMRALDLTDLLDMRPQPVGRESARPGGSLRCDR